MSDIINALTSAPHGATHIGFYGDDIIFIKEHEEARSDAWGIESTQWQEIEDFDVSLIYGVRAIKDVKIEAELLKQIELIKAERDALAKEVDAANDRNAELIEERDALAAENIELRQRKLIHIGFTNESQVQYVTEDKEEGAFYPNSDHGCYIPVYMLNVHAHRVGPDSKIYCTHLEQGKKIAEIRAEAGRAGFVAGADALEVAQIIGFDFDVETSADEYAATVRQGGE